MNLEKVITKIYQKVPFLRFILKYFISEQNRRLFERHSIRKLSDVQLIVKLNNEQTKAFLLRDISLGGLSFFLDSNDQLSLLKPGQFIDIKMIFLGTEFNGKFKIAYVRSGMCGCASLDKRIEYKKFVTEKMSDLLIKSDEFK